MIRLFNVSKGVPDDERGRRVIFDNLNVVVPTSRRVAILVEDPGDSTSFLHLLAGSEIPDGGRVETKGIRRLSPVVYRGASLMPHLTGFQNIAFFARVHGIDPLKLAEIVDNACQFGAKLHKSVRSLDLSDRRELEATLIAALPFDCFLVDRLHELPGDLRWRIFLAARLRKAGFIFTTSEMEVADRFGDFFIVIREGGARAFKNMNRAFAYMDDEDYDDN